LKIYSAGAARGLVEATLSVNSAVDAEGTFAAVGTVLEKLLNGDKADIAILSSEAISKLAARGIVDPSTVMRLGIVRAGAAVREGDPIPSLATAEDMRQTVLAADEIYMPDIERATSGVHLAKVFKELGVMETIAPKLRIFPTGGEAIRRMLSSGKKRPLGFTQASEIAEISGAVLAGLLPKEFELATAYDAAILAAAAERPAAESFVKVLSGQDNRAIRADAGFM
jgi:molybdate transport system substrate-binding protein